MISMTVSYYMSTWENYVGDAQAEARAADYANFGYATALLAPYSATMHSCMIWNEPAEKELSLLVWFLYHTRGTIVGMGIECLVRYVFGDRELQLFETKPKSDTSLRAEKQALKEQLKKLQKLIQSGDTVMQLEGAQ